MGQVGTECQTVQQSPELGPGRFWEGAGDPHICNLGPFSLSASFLPPSPLDRGAWVLHLEPGERHKPLCRFLSALLRFAASPQRVSINTEGEQKEVITAIQTACKLSRSSNTSLPASHTQPGGCQDQIPRPACLSPGGVGPRL